MCEIFCPTQIEGNTVRIHKQPGWLFGDVALLFNSQRSASIVTTTDATLWALNRRAFSKASADFPNDPRVLLPKRVFNYSGSKPLAHGLQDQNFQFKCRDACVGAALACRHKIAFDNYVKVTLVPGSQKLPYIAGRSEFSLV